MTGFDKAALERLMALGRRRGHLTTGDLESELPQLGGKPVHAVLKLAKSHHDRCGFRVAQAKSEHDTACFSLVTTQGAYIHMKLTEP